VLAHKTCVAGRHEGPAYHQIERAGWASNNEYNISYPLLISQKDDSLPQVDAYYAGRILLLFKS